MKKTALIIFCLSAFFLHSGAQVTGGICSITYDSLASEKLIDNAFDSLFKKHILFNDSIKLYFRPDPYYGYQGSFPVAMFVSGNDTIVFEFRLDHMYGNSYKIGVTRYAKFGNKLNICTGLTSKEAKYFRENFKTILVPEIDKYVGHKSEWKSYHQGKLGEDVAEVIALPFLLIAIGISEL